MGEGAEEVRVTLRLPGELHTAVMDFAKGDRSRPRASLNATLLFLIQAGLDQQSQRQGAAQAPTTAATAPAGPGASQGEGAGQVPTSTP